MLPMGLGYRLCSVLSASSQQAYGELAFQSSIGHHTYVAAGQDFRAAHTEQAVPCTLAHPTMSCLRSVWQPWHGTRCSYGPAAAFF